MAKPKAIYACRHCGAQFPKWSGQCGECGKWNTISEEAEMVSLSATTLLPRTAHFAGTKAPEVIALSNVSVSETPRLSTHSSELDRVLGGGLVPGSVVLIGGDPGIGKSTLLLQSVSHISQDIPILYVTGEESLQQVTLRAKRLGLPEDNLKLLTDTQVEHIIQVAQKEKPHIMVIDSIQTMFTNFATSAPGSISQVRESAAQLVSYAKQTNTALFLVGHVTREGTIAGPRVLEHMVDTVLYFEGDKGNRYRIIRAIKNRFGAVNELGIFAMTDKGLKQVSNPSSIFLSRHESPVSGSVMMSTWEGSRPILIELQALVDESHLSNPRRVTVGLEHNRLAMLLAALHRHTGIATYDQDVFVNAVGGVRVMETAADLAMLFAIVSSLKNRPIPTDWIVFGEVGLSGEIRPVQSGQERLKEAHKHGFKRAIVPASNVPKKALPDLDILSVKNLQQALQVI